MKAGSKAVTYAEEITIVRPGMNGHMENIAVHAVRWAELTPDLRKVEERRLQHIAVTFNHGYGEHEIEIQLSKAQVRLLRDALNLALDHTTDDEERYR